LGGPALFIDGQRFFDINFNVHAYRSYPANTAGVEGIGGQDGPGVFRLILL
jgi:hypothetical protein